VPKRYNTKTGKFEDDDKKSSVSRTFSVEVVDGEKGDKGDKGDRGEKGDKGDNGDRGEKGDKGDKGDRGERGEKGLDGKDGRDGLDGINGRDGRDGTDGISVSDVSQTGIGSFSVKLSDGTARSFAIPSASGGGRTTFKNIVDWLEAGSNVTLTPDYTTKKIAIASTGGGGGISDGDKGDITVSGSGATWTIDNGAVTLAKQADMATASVVYRKTAGAGAPEVQTLATLKTDLGLTGTNSGDQTITLTGDVTGTGTGSFATTIANGAVDIAMLSATGTPSGTTYLRGDNTWATVSAGSSAFTDITSGTNTAAAMVVGTGASLGVSGSGTIVATSCTGNAATVTTNANLTGHVTSTGNAAVLGSFTKAQLSTAVSDGDVLYVGDVTQYTDEMAQDAVGGMVNSTLSYVDGTPSLGINLSTANTWAADQSVPDEAYGVGWNGSMEVPTKNALYDKIETLGGSTNSFATIAVSGQSDVVADSSTDTLTIVAGSNITITTDAGTDSITIAATGVGSGITRGQGTVLYTTTSNAVI